MAHVVESSNSLDEAPFVKQKLVVKLSLSPCYTHAIKQGVQEYLNRTVLRYSSALNGVFLGFRNVALVQPHAAIFNEAPHLHCEIKCDALVFQPIVGMKLIGTVNKIGSNHIGMLVAGVFNASISSTELPKGFRYCEEEETWGLPMTCVEDEADPLKTQVRVGSKVEFRVTIIHEANGLISIDGSMRKPKKSKKRSLTTESSSVKKKKKKSTKD